MGSIPAFLLRHEAVVEPLLGAGPAGDVYGPGVTVQCFAETKRRRIRSQTGTTITSHTDVYVPPGTEIPAGSRVTVLGRTGTAESVDVHDGGGLPTPDHVKVVLT